MKKLVQRMGGVVLFAASLIACQNHEEGTKAQQQTAKAPAEAPSAAPPTRSPAAEAQEFFSTRCAACHGETGKGDGPGAVALQPKPRDLSDAEWQKSVEDDYLKKVILEGGAAVQKSVAMPAHLDLKGKPEVLDELVKRVRALAK